MRLSRIDQPMTQLSETQVVEAGKPHGRSPMSMSPDEVLTPKLSDSFAMDGRVLLIAAVFCLLFMHYNYLPLFHSDVWGHVAYGEWILQHGRLPASEPFVPLADGVPVVDTAWLGQVILGLTGSSGDPEWFSHLFAVTAVATLLVLMRVFYLQAGSAGVAACATVLAWLTGWTRHAVIRPEMFGSLCFAVLFWLVVRNDDARSRSGRVPSSDSEARPTAWWEWLAMPLLFAAWSNLHGSFVVGYAVLGCYALGRALEVLGESRSVGAVFNDRRFRRWVVLGELAVVGTLLNPYGFDLILHTFLFPANPNLNDVLEWFPLEMVSLEAFPMAASWIGLVVLLRHSRARMAASDILLLLVFTSAVCLRVRMIAWYAPVLWLVLTPHLGDVFQQLAASNRTASLRRAAQPLYVRSFRITLFLGLLVWVTFTFSPIARPVLGGKPRPADKVFSNDTPLGVTKYLRVHPPEGMVGNPQWWGDWLVYDGPPDIQVFMTTNAVHVVPARVWKDYLAFATAEEGLTRRLNRYRINTIVVCKKLQPSLEEKVRTMPGWRVVFEDEVGLIAQRTSMAQRGRRPQPNNVAHAALRASRRSQKPLTHAGSVRYGQTPQFAQDDKLSPVNSTRARQS